MTLSVIKDESNAFFAISQHSKELDIFQKVSKECGYEITGYDAMPDSVTLEIPSEVAFDFLYRLTCEGVDVNLF